MMIHLLLILLTSFSTVLVAEETEKPFVIGTLNGRLGNQFFQIANALSVALDHDAEAIFPDLVFRKDEGMPLNKEIFFSHVKAELPRSEITFIYDEHPHYHYRVQQYQPNMRLRGFFQSEKYFKHHNDKILPLFAFKEEVEDYVKTKYKVLLEMPNTVAIHIRAYNLEDAAAAEAFENVGMKYIKKAVKHFGPECVFVVFSDKIDWAKAIMRKFSRPHVFIENEAYYHDFILMSLCKHQIISNSSFSWWAAYLNKNPDKKVVAPARWMSKTNLITSEHFVPENWIKVNW